MNNFIIGLKIMFFKLVYLINFFIEKSRLEFIFLEE